MIIAPLNLSFTSRVTTKASFRYLVPSALAESMNSKWAKTAKMLPLNEQVHYEQSKQAEGSLRPGQEGIRQRYS